MSSKKNDEETREMRGPYYLVFGTTPEELEANVNELLKGWPLPYWEFLGYWRDGDCYYRELLRLPQPEPLNSSSVYWLDMGDEYDAYK